ncbi:MAG: HD domain-containing protein [Roseburia sp.]|nr:HD domain-containing protein [Anaeroplasma bactoclasticum]MCM1196931.1 HD domain-containing protein [Roseburia sp.]MCM1557722.1 HD domain-containing protein [Anaeroplasma bactoclasticum]
MEKKYLHYANNLKRFAELDNIVFDSNDSKEFVLETLHNISFEKRKIYDENTQIINEYIVAREQKEDLSDEDVQMLKEFAESLKLRFGSLDNSIYFRIHKLLLKNALKGNDLNKIIEEKYYCGYCEYVLESSKPGVRNLSYFRNVGEYIDQYDLLTVEGKNYFLRAYGNQLLDNDFIYERSKRILEFIMDKKEKEPCADIPYDRYILSVQRNISGALAYFRSCRDHMEDIPEAYLKLVYDAAVYSLDNIQNMKQTSLVSAVLYKYTYYAACFHYGKITIEELLAHLDELSKPKEDYNLIERASSIIKMTAYYIDYYRNYTSLSEDDLIEELQSRVQNVLDFVGSISTSDFTDALNEELISFLKVASNVFPFEKIKDLIFKVLVVRNRSTFIHVNMVKSICNILGKDLLNKNPEFFIGCLDYKNKRDVLLHKEDILRTLEEMAMFHDVGKHFYIKYIALSYRKIDDNEFEIIKLHSSIGYQTLAKGKYPDTIGEAILLHHVWHDGTRGYPEEHFSTKNQPLIDILSIADTLDAATDYVGRPYAMTKTCKDLILEFENFRDTRYAKEVIDILKEEDTYQEVSNALTKGREELAYKIWTNNF